MLLGSFVLGPLVRGHGKPLFFSRSPSVPAEQHAPMTLPNPSTRPGDPERRRYDRVDVHLSTDLLLGSPIAGLTSLASETLNLSEGGARIRVPQELPDAAPLGLVLHLRNGRTHACHARVRRSSRFVDEPGQTGAWAAVEFVEPSPDMRATIAALVIANRGA